MARGIYCCELDVEWPEGLDPAADSSLQLDEGFAALKALVECGMPAGEDREFRMKAAADEAKFSGPFREAVLACWRKRDAGQCTRFKTLA